MRKFTAQHIERRGAVDTALYYSHVPLYGRQANIVLIKDDEGRIICSVHSWGFSACAARTAEGFSTAGNQLLTEDKVALCKFLVSDWSNFDCHNGYSPEECYFLLSQYQWVVNNWQAAIAALGSQAKVVDTYYKKSEHREDKKKMFLVRISLEGDFS